MALLKAFAQAQEGALNREIEDSGGKEAGTEHDQESRPAAVLQVAAQIHAIEVRDLLVREVHAIGQSGDKAEPARF